jgi:hypothetical protein
MAQEQHWPDPARQPVQGVNDLEIRDSIRVMQQQRSTKMTMVIAGIVAAIVALFVMTWLAYKDEPDAAKAPPAATP